MECTETLSVGNVDEGVREVVGGAGAIDIQPPQPKGGNPGEMSPPPHTTHIDNQWGGALEKFLVHPGSLRDGGW